MTERVATDAPRDEDVNRQRFDALYSDPMQSHELQAKGLLTYSRREGRWLLRRIKRLAGLELPRAARVLELGAGSGYGAINMAQASGVDEIDVTFLDIAYAAVRLSVQMGRRHGVASHGLQGNAMALPCAEESFDCVVGRAMMHHIADLEHLLAECWRVTKPGGWVLLFGDPAPGATRYRRFKRSYGRLIHRGRVPVEGESEETARYVRPAEQVRSLMQTQGLEGQVIETDLAHCYLGFLAYPFLLKLKSRQLSAAVNQMLKPLVWVDDAILRHWAPTWTCEQWVVLRRPGGQSSAWGHGTNPAGTPGDHEAVALPEGSTR